MIGERCLAKDAWRARLCYAHPANQKADAKGEKAVVAMTADEFFAWQQAQEDLYELVDGLPLRMMSGASNRHNQITVNLIVEAGLRLRGKSSRPMTQDTGVKISATQVRRPDMTINCGPTIDNSFVASDPHAVFEVLSPSTRLFDHTKKLEEYKSIASLRHIVLIDPDNPELIAFFRQAEDGWASSTISGLDAEVEFVDLGFNLPVAEIYRGLTVRPKPMLVTPE